MSYPQSLAAAIQLTADRLAEDDPAGAELANLCAFLAPEPIPVDLFSGAINELPSEVAARATDPLAWPQTLSQLTRQSLTRVDQRGLQMHRLTQAILRDRLAPTQAAATRECTEAILAVSDPGDPANPATWPQWARLLPHLLAADLAAADNPDLRSAACNTCWYLLARGDFRTGHDLASDLYQHWRDRLGGDHQHTMAAATHLAWALRIMRRGREALDLSQDTLERRRRVLGEDHPDTLRSAGNLADSLRGVGDLEAARDLDQDTLIRMRRVLGEDHPDTLTCASNLAADLDWLWEHGAARDLAARDLAARDLAARDLDEDTLERRRRVLGEDHPDTLTSASNLASELYRLGGQEAARDLEADTLERRRRVLGEDHPDTLTSARRLIIVLKELGEWEAAFDLEADTQERWRRLFGEHYVEEPLPGGGGGFFAWLRN